MRSCHPVCLESCHIYECVVSHMRMYCVACIHASCDERVVSHIWMSHVALMNETCHTAYNYFCANTRCWLLMYTVWCVREFWSICVHKACSILLRKYTVRKSATTTWLQCGTSASHNCIFIVFLSVRLLLRSCAHIYVCHAQTRAATSCPWWNYKSLRLVDTVRYLASVSTVHP